MEPAALVTVYAYRPLEEMPRALLEWSTPRVVEPSVPPSPGVLCAYGDATTRVKDEASRSLVKGFSQLSTEEVTRILEQLTEQVTASLSHQGIAGDDHNGLFGAIPAVVKFLNIRAIRRVQCLDCANRVALRQALSGEECPAGQIAHAPLRTAALALLRQQRFAPLALPSDFSGQVLALFFELPFAFRRPRRDCPRARRLQLLLQLVHLLPPSCGVGLGLFPSVHVFRELRRQPSDLLLQRTCRGAFALCGHRGRFRRRCR